MFVLASASPRRKEILSQWTDDFITVPTEIEEHHQGSPQVVVSALAFEKGRVLLDEYPEDIILSGDTVVALGHEILGKPQSREDARTMLERLSGKVHHVYSGYGILQKSTGMKIVNYTTTEVEFYPLDEEIIERYLDTGEYEDKAGAYALQGKGRILVKRISGHPDTVIGFPIGAITADLKKYFHRTW